MCILLTPCVCTTKASAGLVEKKKGENIGAGSNPQLIALPFLHSLGSLVWISTNPLKLLRLHEWI